MEGTSSKRSTFIHMIVVLAVFTVEFIGEVSSAPANTQHENVSPAVETVNDGDHSGEGITDEGFFTTKKTTTRPPANTCHNCADKNPCRNHPDKLYFGHTIPSKFVQCDAFGGCFEMDCPPTLVWDIEANTCNYRSAAVTCMS